MKKESSVNFDDLDQERDDLALETEGIDDMEYFLNEVSATLKESGSDISRIKILEKGLEDDKRRLANMEMQLREAKRQRDAENQMTVVTKQSKMLETMMGALSTAAHKEMGNRQRWEMEWRERFADFQTQHREMEEALKRKHLQELKAVKDEIQRDIRRVANEVQRTKGKNMPSPRTLSQMQEGNMGRILILFQKHGLERMTLASKVSKQEETLVHAKNQSLQKMMNMSQTKSTGLYKKILPSIKTGKRFELEDDADEVATGGATQSTGGRLSHDGSLSPATRDQSRQRSRSSLGASRGGGNTRERTNTSWSMRSAAPLPSPRIDYNNTTFLTGIEDEYEGNPKPGSYARPSKVNNGRGEAGDTAANVSAQKHDGDKESSILHTAQPSTQGGASSLLQSIPNQHVGPSSYFRNPENAQFAKGVPDPASYRGGGPEYMTNPNVGQEFAKGWAPPAPPAEAGRPNWNEGGMTHGFPQAPSTTMLGHMGQGLGQQLGQQWHPNIIAFDKSTTGYGQDQTKKASTKNPYLAPQPLSKKAKGGGPTSAQGTQKERSNGVADKQNSSGARGSATQAADPRRRSKSTEPVHSKTFPKVSDSGRQQPTDQNSNRPFSELGKNDDFSLLQKDKVGKLETWIEDKIKGVLGNSASRSNILDRLATASSFGDLAGPSRGTTGFATRAPTGDYSLASTAPGDYAEEGGSRMPRVPSTSQGIRGDSNAVAGLMNSLKTRTEDDPKISKAMSHNTGFGMEDQNYKQKQIREYEQSHKGASVEQDFEVSDSFWSLPSCSILFEISVAWLPLLNLTRQSCAGSNHRIFWQIWT